MPHNNLGEELLQIVDENTGDLVGKQVTRKELIENKYWCRTTNIFIMNSKGEILCHQRSLNKERYPGWWMTHFGGHVSGEETYDENAIKEVEEELGLNLNKEELLPWRKSKIEESHCWAMDYVAIYDEDISNLKLQESEIGQVKWFSPEEIFADLKKMEEANEAVDIEDSNPKRNWKAGIHGFEIDYNCIRAVLTSAMHMGLFHDDFHHMKKWTPSKQEI